MTDPVIVLVHGAWGAPGIWEYVTPEIEAAGLDCVAADLPTMQSPGATLADDVAHVRSLWDDDRSAVLVGHSYGGAVITEAAVDVDNVHHLVYLASIVVDEGESFFDWGGKRETGGAPLDFREDGTAMVTQWGDPGQYDEMALRLFERNPPRPFAVVAATTPVSGAPWRSVPSSFVLATDDLVIHPDTQREIATRAGRTVELSGGHLVVGTHPREVAAVVVEAARTGA